MTPGALIRSARQSAGITQRELALRMGTTQPAVAHLESQRSNPTVATLERALGACGRRLSLELRPEKASIDDTLVAAALQVPPEHRLQRFGRAYAEMRELALAGRRARGELG